MLGEVKVPAQAYYGVNTVRAVENFSISGTTDLKQPRSYQRACVREAGCSTREP